MTWSGRPEILRLEKLKKDICKKKGEMASCNHCPVETDNKCSFCKENYCEDHGLRCAWCGKFECIKCVLEDDKAYTLKWEVAPKRRLGVCKGHGLNIYMKYSTLEKEHEKLKKDYIKLRKRSRSAWEKELKELNEDKLLDKMEDICREVKRRKKNVDNNKELTELF